MCAVAVFVPAGVGRHLKSGGRCMGAEPDVVDGRMQKAACPPDGNGVLSSSEGQTTWTRMVSRDPLGG
jgi:hypothetical protein